MSPVYFLKKYAYIQTRARPPKKIKWQPWQYHLDLLQIFQLYDEIVIEKARQLGITWLVALYCLWQSLFYGNAKVLYLSQGEQEAWDILAKTRYAYLQLPEFFRLKTGNDTRSWFSFDSSDSEIKALPSTDKAGRGTDATIVLRDELAKHPYGAENYSAISPAIDSGGQLIDLSTINKLEPANHFSERIRMALNDSTKKVYTSGLELYTGGESGAALVFLSWRLRPVRQEGMTLDEWFETRIKKKYTKLEIEQEYPTTLDEALKPSETRSFFDQAALGEMGGDVNIPLRGVTEFNTFDGIIRVHRKPVIGRYYIAFCDPSDGVDDPFAAIIMDWRTGEGVCTAHAKVPADEVARIFDTMCRAYNNAYWSLEVNSLSGGKCIETMKSLNTPNMAPRRDPQGKIVKDKLGWYTTPQHRRLMLDTLEESVRKRTSVIHDRDALLEFGSMMRPEGKDPAVPHKGHDDWILAWAGCVHIAKYFQPYAYEVTSGKYKG